MDVVDVTEGKYYNTTLKVWHEDGTIVVVEIASQDPKPSYKTIEKWGSEEEFYSNNCNGHYERKATRDVADAIIERLKDA